MNLQTVKVGKQHIYDLPIQDVTTLGVYAQQLEREAETRGEVLPPAVRLHIGEPDFRTPEHIRRAAIHSIENELQTYAPAAGWPWLRELLVEKVKRVNGYSVGPANIAIAMGGTGAVMAALMATMNSGDEVLIPDPSWPLYFSHMAACSLTGVPYPLDPANGWLPDIALLEQRITPRTRALIINSPGNPTGAVFPLEVMRALLDFARRHDLYLISDECYDQIVFEGEHISPATLLSPAELEAGRFIGIYTFSKTYAMTGWRIGYAVAGSKLIKTMTEVLNVSCTNISTQVQRAAAAALTGPQDCVVQMRDAYRHRRDLAVGLLKEFGRYQYTPQGAFYILVGVQGKHGESHKGRQFALDLVHTRNVTVAPGSGFGSVAGEYVRVSLASSDEQIERGIREICLFADK